MSGGLTYLTSIYPDLLCIAGEQDKKYLAVGGFTGFLCFQRDKLSGPHRYYGSICMDDRKDDSGSS